MAWKVQSQYSSSDSPFQAKTGKPALAMAAAAWSWVEKILQLAHRTDAPKAARLSMSTAVSTVMCNDPVMRTPCSGLAWAYLRRMAMRPGISCSAMSMALRPYSARLMSLTLKSRDWPPFLESAVLAGLVLRGAESLMGIIMILWLV